MNFTTTDKIKINFKTYGEQNNEPILLIHSLGADNQMWKSQIQELTNDNYHLIVPDIRGHGKTKGSQKFTINEATKDIKELLNHLKIKQTNIIGTEMGGIIAQKLAIQNPEKIKKIILVDTYSGPKGLRGRISAKILSITLKMIPKSIIKETILGTYKGGETMDEIRQYFEKTIKNTDLTQIKQAKQELNNINLLKQIKQIKTPTLVIIGNRNPKYYKQMSQQTKKQIPNAKIKTIKEGKNPTNLVNPKKFNQTTKKYLKQNQNQKT